MARSTPRTARRDGSSGLRYNPTSRVTALCSPTRAALADRPQTVAQDQIRLLSVDSPTASPGTPRCCTRLHALAPDPEGQRLQHGRVRQMAPDPRRAAGGRPAGPLAHQVEGFDYFYGFLGGGARMGSVLAENQKIIGTDPGYYDPENPYYLPDSMAEQADHLAARRPGTETTQPSRSSPTSRPDAATRRITWRASWARQVQGSVRPGLRDLMREEVFTSRRP